MAKVALSVINFVHPRRVEIVKKVVDFVVTSADDSSIHSGPTMESRRAPYVFVFFTAHYIGKHYQFLHLDSEAFMHFNNALVSALAVTLGDDVVRHALPWRHILTWRR